MLRTKLRTDLAGLLATAVLVTGVGLSAYRAVGQQPQAEEEKPGFRFLAYEGFQGKLGLNWQPVRPDPAYYSLTKHPGTLTIITQRGTIHGEAGGEPSARNLFVVPNPLSKDADFVMTTSVRNFMPTQSYQQAALICYDDDDNYLKWSYEYNWTKESGQYFVLVREVEAEPEHFKGPEVSDLTRVWLRLTKRGKTYEYASSTDGKTFTSHGE